MLGHERQVNSSLSAEIVEFLRKQGLTLKKIGQFAGASESFISRVARRERSFTIDHLAKLEQGLNLPLPLLILQSSPKDSVPKELRNSYEEALKLLESSGKSRLALSAKSSSASTGRLSSKSRAAS